MAILEKRRAVNQLPRFQRYQDTRAGDRAAALRGETPITSAIRQLAGSSGYDQMADAQGFVPMGGGMGGRGGMGGAGPVGGAGKGAVDKFGNMAGQPKTAVTSALKGSTAAGKTAGTTAAGTTSKLPGLTSKTAGTTGTTGKTLTSTGTGAGKVAGATGAKTTGTTGAKTSGSNLGSKLTSALAGAALGAGTKMAIDKLTGTKKAVSGTDKTSNVAKDTTKGVTKDTSKTSGTGLTSKTNILGDNIGKKIVGDTGVGKVVDTSKTAGTGTAKTTGTAGTGTAKTTGTTGTAKTGTTGTTGTAKAITTGVAKKVSDTVGKKVADGVTSVIKPKSPVTPATKGASKTGTPKTGGAGTKTAGPATKTGAGGADDETNLTDDEVDAELDRVRDSEESFGVPEGAVDNGDGTYSVTEDGMVTVYDADGNIVSMEAAEDETFGDDAGVGGGDSGTTSDDDGTTTQVLDDGTTVTLDSNGDIVSYTDTDGVTYDGDGNEIGDDTVGGGDVGGEGNTTEVLEDGTEITYNENGDIVSYTDTDGVTYDGDGEVIDGSDTLVTGDEETAEDAAYEGLYSDDEGNLYDPDGNLVQYADGTYYGDEESTEGEVAYTDEYGNTYDYNGDLLAEADHSDYVQYDDYGNSYDWDGNLIEYAEGYGAEDEYAAEDGYSAEDEYSSEDEYSYDDDYSYDDYYDFKKGGVAHMQEGGETEDEDVEPVDELENEDGTITQYFDDGSSITYDADGEVVDVTEATEEFEAAPAFATRGLSARDTGYSDTGEEVQDFQNVGYNFGESDDATMTGYTLTGNRNPVGNTYSGASGEEGDVEYFDDGSYIVSYGDGSSVTYDSDGAVYQYTSNGVENSMAEQQLDRDTSDTSTVGGLTQAGQGNIQYFDDGSSIETFDDGSTITYDSDGNVFSTSNAYETTYDDEGNAMVTDSYGNIVAVYDPQGNVIPLGGGRVTGPTEITSAGSTGAVGVNSGNPVQQKIEEQKTRRETQSAIDSLLAGLNTYGGAGAAGAVLGALLSDSDLFAGGGGGGQSFDMTGVGAINPRTTDFGIGPANYVGYDQYGTPEQMPELYGRELYQNLNAPGFNEVNPGDYARYDEAEFGPSEGYAEEPEYEAQGMAEGGMPQGGLGQTAPQTYYTFGKPVDPLQNLRNPAPFQQQQPQMQPQLPPQAAQNAQQVPPQQALPQMGMAPTQPSIPQGVPPAGIGMKSGGLPAWSDVPITNGRLNFRKGAPVHGPGDGQSDDIPAMLADGEYVIDAETVAQIGNGSTKAGAQALDKFRENIRRHKRSAPVNKIPPKTKALTSYLKGAR